MSPVLFVRERSLTRSLAFSRLTSTQSIFLSTLFDTIWLALKPHGFHFVDFFVVWNFQKRTHFVQTITRYRWKWHPCHNKWIKCLTWLSSFGYAFASTICLFLSFFFFVFSSVKFENGILALSEDFKQIFVSRKTWVLSPSCLNTRIEVLAIKNYTRSTIMKHVHDLTEYFRIRLIIQHVWTVYIRTARAEWFVKQKKTSSVNSKCFHKLSL